jgi:RNA polymerase sigma-54 factor
MENADGREAKPEEIEAVLLELQDTLMPPGIAARTLREALTRKLERHPADGPLRDETLTILREHFELFRKRKYDDLMSATGLSRENLRAVYALVKRLRPHPGTATDPVQSVRLRGEGAAAPYVEPDFAVTPDREVIPSDSWLPQLRISGTHDESLTQLKTEKQERKEKLDRLERALSKLDEDSEEKERLENKAQRVRQEYEQAEESYGELKKQKREARELLQALYHQRQPTRQRVVKAVADFQAEFFREGPDALKRMTRKDIADKIQDVADEIRERPNVAAMSAETVRRISNSCYIDTQYGLFRLADLFSRGKAKVEGRDNPSTQVVRRRLRELLEAEEEPLSDGKLADRLEEQGVEISRRTVAKYRKQLGFPTARLRKKI